ncbi:MAG: S24 family peptidase [Treponema sp.]|nr:S24 family peptidase [Candidatus Treponema caballi]
MFVSDKPLCVADNDNSEYDVNRKRIPLLGQKVSCGPGQNWDSEDNIIEYIDVSELSPSIHGKDVYAFRAAGTSMLGAGIKDGDIVLFSAAQNQKLSDGIYVFGLDGEAYCKRLEFDPIAQRIKIYSVRVADLEKAELLTTLTASDPGYAERFTLFGRVFSWIHVINSGE